MFPKLLIYSVLKHVQLSYPRSRGSTKRSKADPLGARKGATEIGNIMAARVAILLFICAARGIFWVLEQPKGSLFEFHPQIQAVFTALKCFKKTISMGDFGAASLKPTWLYSGAILSRLRVWFVSLEMAPLNNLILVNVWTYFNSGNGSFGW